MPQVDKLIEKMKERNIERVLIASGQPMRLFASGREATGPTMTNQQLQSLIEEVAPPLILSQLANQGQLNFPYQSPSGVFNLSLERKEGELKVAITPFNSVANPIPTSSPLVAPPSTPPPVSIAPSPRQNSKLLAVVGGLGALVVVLGGVWFVNNTKATQEKAAMAAAAQAQQVQAQQSGDAYNSYIQEINGLSQVGVVVTQDEYPLATADSTTFNATVADLDKRIRVDAKVEGTETSGPRATLLALLKDSTNKNQPIFRVASINNQVEQKLKTHLLATGKSTEKEAAVQQTIIKRKGVDAWLNLYDNTGTYAEKVQQMFPG